MTLPGAMTFAQLKTRRASQTQTFLGGIKQSLDTLENAFVEAVSEDDTVITMSSEAKRLANRRSFWLLLFMVMSANADASDGAFNMEVDPEMLEGGNKAAEIFENGLKALSVAIEGFCFCPEEKAAVSGLIAQIIAKSMGDTVSRNPLETAYLMRLQEIKPLLLVAVTDRDREMRGHTV